ncbi:MAG: insulinase family protein [Candidatus Melainabacteria bacterium]|nr:insulinase family protein [Candidatus Melainabacteria bacterium]
MKMKSKVQHCVAVLALILGVVMPANASEWSKPLIPVTKDFKLPNGLRVLLSEDHSVPVASVVIVFDVGARNEEKGRSGFAHLFEHMMFEGSENVGKTEYFKYIESAGGSLNASTHADFTNYFEKLPSNQIELALWLESDRMRSLKVTEDNFKNQLETVKEEKRSGIDNQPYTPAYIKFEELLFDNWQNAHPVIGSFADLEASSVEDVKKFFKTYYAPNNAVMAVVGDFDAAQMQSLVEKYFASISSQPTPPKPDVSESEQTKNKYLKVNDVHAQLPAFWFGWKAPARRDPDYYALGLIEKLLSAGDSSRLYQRLVKGTEVALKAEMWLDERRGPGAVEGFVMYKPGNSPEKVRSIIWQEIDQLKTTPVSSEELEKAKNQVLRGLFSAGSYQSLQRSLGKAELLAEYALFFGDPKYIDEDLERFMQVTPADIMRVAKKTFTQPGITIVDVEPSKPKAESSRTKETVSSLR